MSRIEQAAHDAELQPDALDYATLVGALAFLKAALDMPPPRSPWVEDYLKSCQEKGLATLEARRQR